MHRRLTLMWQNGCFLNSTGSSALSIESQLRKIEALFAVTPTQIFQRPSRPYANTGRLSATHAAADHHPQTWDFTPHTVEC